MEEEQPVNIVEPRKLLLSEIDDIVNGLPRQTGSIDKVINKSMEQQEESLRAQLESIVIVPAGIAQLKENIYSQYEKTRAVPGTVVGIRASLRLGAPLTQGALNSFHQSGARKESLRGIDAVTTLITASASKKGRSVTIHFNDKAMGIDDIIATGKDFVESTVSSLTDEPIVDIPSALFEAEPSWYSLYRDTVGTIPSARARTGMNGHGERPETSILELNMNVYLLYVNGVTTGDVARKIEEATNKNGGDNIVCVYSPTKIGKIHIYPNNDAVAATIPDGATVPDPSLYFINSTLLGKLSEIVIKGVKDISALHPVDYPIWGLVQHEERIRGTENQWKLILNQNTMHIMGIGRNEVIRLAHTIGMENMAEVKHGYNEVYLRVVKIPEGESNKISPGKLVSYYDELSGKLEDEFDKQKQKQKQKGMPSNQVFEETPYQKVSKYWYAETEGSNLSIVRSMHVVDPVHTYSNDINEIYTILGVEATRNFIILRILDIIEQGGGNVSPKDVMVLADNMVNYGVITKMTGPSMQKNVGFLTAATSQRPVDIFRDASANGGYEEIAGAAASIIVGNLPKIGTAYHNHPELSDKIDQMIQLAIRGGHVDLDDQDFSDSISNMEGLLYGESRVQSDDINVPSFVYGPTVDKTVPMVSMPMGKAKPEKPIRVIPRGADNVMLKEAVDDIASGSHYDPNINITFDMSSNIVTIESHELTTRLVTQQDIDPPISKVPVIALFTDGPPASLLNILAGKMPSLAKDVTVFAEDQQVLDLIRVPKTVVSDKGPVDAISMGTLTAVLAIL